MPAWPRRHRHPTGSPTARPSADGSPDRGKGSWWQAWRRWRRSRPFWGGLLVILGATEILVSERAPLPIVIHIGLQGLAGYLIPVLSLLCGLLLLFHPVQRTFYSILAILLALGSWITSNLGGFLVGMLLGVIGGSLAFAWQWSDGSPERRRQGSPSQDQPSVGLELIRGEPTDTIPERADADTRPGPDARSAGRDRGQVRTFRAALPERTGKPRRLTASAAPAVPFAPVALSVLVGGASPGLAAPIPPGPAPAVTASPATTGPSLPPGPSPFPAGPSLLTAGHLAGPVPSPAGPATPPPRKPTPAVPPAAAPAARKSAAPATLGAGLLTMTGLSFDGIASVRTVNGVMPMLRFSMRSLTASGGIMLTVSQAGHALRYQDSSLEFRGNVVLYTTRISGEMRGTRVSFTTGRPPSRLRPDLTLANAVLDRLSATADSLLADGLRLGPAAQTGGG